MGDVKTALSIASSARGDGACHAALTTRWVSAACEDVALTAAWRQLLEKDLFASLFQSPDWVWVWWKHHAADQPLQLLTVWRADRLLALCPFVRAPLGWRGRGISGLVAAGEPRADQLGVLCDPAEPEAGESLFRAMLEAARTHGAVVLPEVVVGSALDRWLLDGGSADRVTAVGRLTSRAPVLWLDQPLEAIKGGYDQSLRSRLRQARNRQRAAGEVVFRRWTPETEEAPELIMRFHAIEQCSWKGQQGTGCFATWPRVRFAAELAERLCIHRQLDVATLDLEDETIAYRFGFRFGGRFLDYNLAHDPYYDRLSPGRVLLDEIVHDSHRLGLRAVDASRGRLHPPHLLADWTSVSRWHRRWMLFGRSVSGRALQWLESRIKPTWRAARGRAAPIPGAPALLVRRVGNR